jgi:flagellar secretion chaperone FliS
VYGKPSALQNYGRIANSSADPIQQIVMLYDGAIKFLRLAAQNIEVRDFEGKLENTTRALDIINYLQGILDFERGGEVAKNLDALYTMVNWTILKASASLNASEMNRAADLLAPVRESWAINAQAGASVSIPPAPGANAGSKFLATA